MAIELEITDEAGEVRRVVLGTESLVIGRSSEADIQLERSTVSRQHARLTPQNGAWTIIDLDSRSGTKVNGRRVKQRVVGPRDEIQVSRFMLRLIDESHQDLRTTTAFLSDQDAPDISTLIVGSAPKVGYEQIGLLNTFGQTLMDDAVESSRMRSLCRLLVEKVVGAQWALVIETQAETISDPRVLAGWPDKVLGMLDTLHLSRTAIAATLQGGSPVLATNDRHRDGVELSIVADAPSAVAVCPLGQVDGWDRLLYVTLPPACATTDWLAVISLAAKEYQQAEALLREQELARNRSAIEQDLGNARAIQHSILPDQSLDLGFEIAWSFVPCEAVGGDLVDIVELPDGKVMVAIADVSGHGLAAALATLSIHSVLRTCIKSGLGAEAMMTMLNEHLCAYLPVGRFVTMIAVIVDPISGETQSINAGHHAPLVVNRSGDVRELNSEHHLILGVQPGPMPPANDRLEDGDTMLLYTDGLIELTLDDGSMLRTEGLSELLSNACSPQRSIDDLTKQIRKQIDDLQANRPALDDQSFLLLRHDTAI